jgi:hypothetical protein
MILLKNLPEVLSACIIDRILKETRLISIAAAS